jgi:7,8-dihydropterin-6-yl-methyl-4-(beta-D-ribofuranosyl)aminobenzene 5'-phosphate synthase
VIEFEIGQRGSDKMLDDSALAFKTKNGAVVVTGCSHSGICNMCEYAKKITGQKLYAVIGGFHLLHASESLLDNTIDYFKNEKPKLIFPMHCVDTPALSRFYSEFGIMKVAAGDIIKVD